MKHVLTAALGAAAAFLLGVLGARVLRPRHAPPADIVRFHRILPRSLRLHVSTPGALAMAADGRSAVYTIDSGGTTALLIQYLDKVQPVLVPGTAGARSPFLSADGTKLGMFTPEGALRELDLTRGISSERVGALMLSEGATFGPDDALVFGVRGEGLRRVRADRKTPEPLTQVDRTRGERDHVWPRWVPALDAVLFTVTYETPGQEQVAIARLDRPGPHRLVAPGRLGRFLEPGVLIVGRHDGIWASAFDVRSGVAGAPQLVAADAASSDDGTPQFDADGSHVAFVPAASGGDAVVMTDLGGSVYLLDERGPYAQPRLSPDGSALAVTYRDSQKRGVLAIYSVAGGELIRQWFETAVEPRWSADGRWVVFATASNDSWQLRWVSREGAVDRSAGSLLTETSSAGEPWRAHAHETLRSIGGFGVWSLPEIVDRGTPSCPEVVQERSDRQLQAFPTMSAVALRRVTVAGVPRAGTMDLEAGSFEPVWSADGRWLFYRYQAGLRRRRVRSMAPIRLDSPEPVIPGGFVDGACGVPNYDVSADGSRVVSVQRDAGLAPSKVRFILNYRPEPLPH